MSSTVELKIFVITARVKNYKSIIRENKKNYDKTLWLSKLKTNSVEVLIPKVLIDSNITHDGFVLINIVPKELDDIKAKMKNYDEK